MPRRRFRTLTVRLLALFTGLALTVGLLEALVRLVGLESASYSSISGFCRHDPHLGWNLIPENRMVFKGRHFSALVETTAQGLRDRVYPQKPERGRERILVLGDSIAWCWGVEIEECFTKLVEGRLPATDVITMGVPGYSTAQSLLLWERQGEAYAPDRVLLVFVGNDPVENLDGRKRPRFMLEGNELVLTNYPVPHRKSKLKEWLRAHSRLYLQADHALQVARARLTQWRKDGMDNGGGEPRTNLYVLPTESERDEAWALTEALLDRLRRGVVASGARFDLVGVDNSAFMVERLRAFCAARGCRLLDFDPILREAERENRPVRIRGDVHLAPEGQELLAGAVLEFLAGRSLARDGAIR